MGLVYDIPKESMNMQRECSKPLVLVGFHWYIQGMCVYIYIEIERERKKERKKQRKKERQIDR
jgi:hypothetical protein